MIFSFGQTEYERVQVDILSYERAPVGQYHDDNWLVTKIQVVAGGFRGKVDASLLTGELEEFISGLRLLYDTLSGMAKFTTMEGQLRLHLIGDGLGHIELEGELMDRPGIGNRFNFTLKFDQSQLGELIQELEKIIAKFPVRLSK